MMRVFLWWLLPGSNWGHAALQAAALPTELKSHTVVRVARNSDYFTRVTRFRQGSLLVNDFSNCFGQLSWQDKERLLAWLGANLLKCLECTDIDTARNLGE